MARRACQVEWPVSTLTLQSYQSCWPSHSEASGWRKNAFRSHVLDAVWFDLHWIGQEMSKSLVVHRTIQFVELWTSKILCKLLMKVTWPKWITRVLKRELWRFPWERIWRGGATFQQNSRKETVRGAMNLFVSFQSLGMSRPFHEGHAACTGRSFFSVSTEMTPDRANGETGSWVESVVKFNIASVASLI